MRRCARARAAHAARRAAGADAQHAAAGPGEQRISLGGRDAARREPAAPAAADRRSHRSASRADG